VSPSRDNLPAASTHERMDAVEAELPVIAERTRKTLADVRWILVAVLGGAAAVVVGTWGTVAWAQDAGTKAVAPVAAEVAKVEARVAALEKGQADMQRMTVETNATLKLVAMRLGVTPITLEQPKDAGQ